MGNFIKAKDLQNHDIWINTNYIIIVTDNLALKEDYEVLLIQGTIAYIKKRDWTIYNQNYVTMFECPEYEL